MSSIIGISIIGGLRWIARIFSFTIAGFFGAFFVAHLREWFGDPGNLPPLAVWLTMTVHFTLIAGYFIGWKWERLGSIMVIVSAILFFGAANSEKMLPLFAIATAPAWTLLFCNWRERVWENEDEPREISTVRKVIRYILIGGPSILALIFVVELFTHSGKAYTEETMPPGIVGTWRGTTAVTPRLSQERGWVDIDVVMTISPDGEVTGMVGNAQFQNAQVLKNRNWFYRKINFYTDHMVEGYLEGGVVLGDPIPRKTITIPFNHENGTLSGGIQAIMRKTFEPMGTHLRLEKD